MGEDFYTLLVKDTPTLYEEAMKSPNISIQKKVNNSEIKFILGNNNSILTDLPPENKLLGYKQIFSKKLKD